jgi:hypothetical protein
VWATALGPAPVPGLYDGRFQGLPGSAPFNWRLASDPSARAAIAMAPDGGPALQVERDGGRAGRLAAQLLVLPPGAYRLHGEASKAGPALAWSLACEDGGPLGVVRAPSGDAWTAFALPFAVPAQGCAAQWLRLEAVHEASGQRTQAWFRGLAVERVAP